VGTTPGQTEPRFPGFDVTEQAHTWDATTARVVLKRLVPPSPMKFFTAEEIPTARALVDRLLAQDGEPRVPVLEEVDRRLAVGDGDGYRYSDMPDDATAWKKSIAGLDDDARAASGEAAFADLGRNRQMQIIERVRLDKGLWHGMPAQRVFGLWMRYAARAFYAHPWAWNEIGFGGPAYPRGYKNLGIDRREPFEVAEVHAADPIPWVERVEAARIRHEDALCHEGEPEGSESKQQTSNGANGPQPGTEQDSNHEAAVEDQLR